MRAKFSRLLTDAALADSRVLLLTGDHGYALFDEFRRECPGQYINCGVAEQNMVGVAAGLAKGGFRPIVYGLSAFVPMRVLEQIKIDICYESLPVMLVGDGAGVVYSQLGASHQSTEDIAALRPLPNLEIFAPADKFELPYCFQHMLASSKPGYLRFGKADLGDIHQSVPTAPIGDLLPVKDGAGKAAIIATGSMVKTALAVAGEMPVWSAPSLSPFNAAQLAGIAAGYETIFVLEEHATAGGFGGLVAEVLGDRQPTRVIRIGTEKFSELCGTYSYLMSYHGIAAADVARKIEATMKAAA
jgi:transketolase